MNAAARYERARITSDRATASRRLSLALAALATVVGTTVLAAQPAGAHHAEISASIVCVGEDLVLSWTATSWDLVGERGLHPEVIVDISLDGATWMVVGTGAFTDQNGRSFSGTTVLEPGTPAARVGATASDAPWGSGTATGGGRRTTAVSPVGDAGCMPEALPTQTPVPEATPAPAEPTPTPAPVEPTATAVPERPTATPAPVEPTATAVPERPTAAPEPTEPVAPAVEDAPATPEPTEPVAPAVEDAPTDVEPAPIVVDFRPTPSPAAAPAVTEPTETQIILGRVPDQPDVPQVLGRSVRQDELAVTGTDPRLLTLVGLALVAAGSSLVAMNGLRMRRLSAERCTR